MLIDSRRKHNSNIANLTESEFSPISRTAQPTHNSRRSNNCGEDLKANSLVFVSSTKAIEAAILGVVTGVEDE